MVVTENGTICRQAVAKISTQRRSSMGVKIIKLDDGDKIIAMKGIPPQTDEVEDLQATNKQEATLL